MERTFEFNDIPVKAPDTFQPSMATTSTDDSDRTQDLVMHNTPMGTVESYAFEWRYIEPEEAAKIVQQIKNKGQYKLRYMSADTGTWETGYFYTSNYSFGTLRVANGGFVWEKLSFNAVGIDPV